MSGRELFTKMSVPPNALGRDLMKYFAILLSTISLLLSQLTTATTGQLSSGNNKRDFLNHVGHGYTLLAEIGISSSALGQRSMISHRTMYDSSMSRNNGEGDTDYANYDSYGHNYQQHSSYSARDNDQHQKHLQSQDENQQLSEQESNQEHIKQSLYNQSTNNDRILIDQSSQQQSQQPPKNFLTRDLIQEACDLDRGSQRNERINNSYLFHCSRYKLEDLLSNELLMSIMHHDSRDCAQLLDEFIQLDEVIQQFDRLFKNLLTRYNCHNGYSVKWNCEDCKVGEKIVVGASASFSALVEFTPGEQIA